MEMWLLCWSQSRSDQMLPDYHFCSSSQICLLKSETFKIIMDTETQLNEYEEYNCYTFLCWYLVYSQWRSCSQRQQMPHWLLELSLQICVWPETSWPMWAASESHRSESCCGGIWRLKEQALTEHQSSVDRKDTVKTVWCDSSLWD